MLVPLAPPCVPTPPKQVAPGSGISLTVSGPQADAVPTDDGAIRQLGISQAFEGTTTLRYDEDADTITDVRDDTVRQLDMSRIGAVLSNDPRDIGEALGQLYVEKYFPPAAKARMMEMIANITAVMRDAELTLEHTAHRIALGAAGEQAPAGDEHRARAGGDVGQGRLVQVQPVHERQVERGVAEDGAPVVAGAELARPGVPALGRAAGHGLLAQSSE